MSQQKGRGLRTGNKLLASYLRHAAPEPADVGEKVGANLCQAKRRNGVFKARSV